MTGLLIISSTPARRVEGDLSLDVKFVEGMRLFARDWDGPVGCLLRESDIENPFGQTYAPSDLPFEVRVQSRAWIDASDLSGFAVLLGSGDEHTYLSLPDAVDSTAQKLVYVIENAPQTRRQFAALAPDRGPMRKLYSHLWLVRHEMRRRRAFRACTAIQANGFPARQAYQRFDPDMLMYFDNRMTDGMMANERDMAARKARLEGGRPLRLLHSGRLEPIKGSLDLIDIARHLDAKGVAFELDIFGSGSLEAPLRDAIAAQGLKDRVKLHGAVDFETELIPFARENSDVFVSCHRQSDPSCTYLESMGCGLPIAGYDNAMWSALCAEASAGWTAPLGNPHALADVLVRVSKHPTEIMSRASDALSFSRAHSFEHEFTRRMAHLRLVAGLD